jgi:hypothetical protein
MLHHVYVRQEAVVAAADLSVTLATCTTEGIGPIVDTSVGVALPDMGAEFNDGEPHITTPYGAGTWGVA